HDRVPPPRPQRPPRLIPSTDQRKPRRTQRTAIHRHHYQTRFPLTVYMSTTIIPSCRTSRGRYISTIEEFKTMTVPVGRRSFVAFLAGLVPGYKLFPFDKFLGNRIAFPHSQNQTKTSYVCPPCGLSCDKLTFDKPGDCPNCGMKLISIGGEDSPPTVAILLFNGAEIIDFAGPWEVFGTAGFLVHTVAQNLEPITMVFGQRVMPDYTFDNSPKADVLLIPGGGLG